MRKFKENYAVKLFPMLRSLNSSSSLGILCYMLNYIKVKAKFRQK